VVIEHVGVCLCVDLSIAEWVEAAPQGEREGSEGNIRENGIKEGGGIRVAKRKRVALRSGRTKKSDALGKREKWGEKR